MPWKYILPSWRYVNSIGGPGIDTATACETTVGVP